MGGSSLCPEVLRMTYGKIAGYPDLHVLDSTDPAQVKAFENKIDIAKTLFIVSSKSGSTLEPNIFKQYFFERTKQVVGADKAGSHFIAITDPGSKMQQVAEGDRFRHIFFGRSLRSAGAIPRFHISAWCRRQRSGLDTKKFLDRAQEMVRACGPSAPVEENPGAVLGIILGTATRSGRDKVTIIHFAGYLRPRRVA
jgi:transaldolase / glucose-6-phosphate isomerase